MPARGGHAEAIAYEQQMMIAVFQRTSSVTRETDATCGCGTRPMHGSCSDELRKAVVALATTTLARYDMGEGASKLSLHHYAVSV